MTKFTRLIGCTNENFLFLVGKEGCLVFTAENNHFACEGNGIKFRPGTNCLDMGNYFEVTTPNGSKYWFKK